MIATVHAAFHSNKKNICKVIFPLYTIMHKG